MRCILAMGALAAGLALGFGLGVGGAAANGVPEADSRLISVAEVWNLFSGNSEVAVGSDRRVYYDPNGRAVGVAGIERLDGVWFVDPLGRHCFRWRGDDKTRCDEILREGKRYVRVRGEKRRHLIEIRPGNPFRL